MKKITKFLIGMATTIAALAIATPAVINRVETFEPDNVEYSDIKTIDLDQPNFASDDEDEGDEDVGPISKVTIHYVNEKADCKNRAFYIWVNGVDGVEYSDDIKDIVNKEGSGVKMTYSGDGTSMTIELDLNNERFAAFKGRSSLMYIVKFKMISASNLNWGGQSDDVELHYSEFPPVNEEVEVWSTPAAGGGMAQFATEAETKVDGVKLAKFTDWKTITCEATKDSKNVSWSLYAFDENYFRVKAKKRDAIMKNYLVKTGTNAVPGEDKTFSIKFKYSAHVNVVYCIVSKDTNAVTDLAKTVYVSYEKLYETSRFTSLYTYNGASDNDLGMTYTPEATTFKVWAPTAANMSLLLYDSNTSAAYGGDDKYKGYHMDYTKGGVWAITIKGDLKNKYYALQVDNTLGTSVTMDPYATACGTSGVRGMVYDKADTNPEGWDQLPLVWNGNTTFKWNSSNAKETAGLDLTTPQELTIYEVHIADLTGDSSWNGKSENGTYNAFVESGTRLAGHSDVTTGYDHLNELGVRAVQLMPVFDSDNDESFDENGVRKTKYNWGYNPLNYNCVEGAYSSDPSDGTVRIKEYKNLVLQMSKTNAHTRVIMDVVYNHVSSPSASCFNKLMPRYYFRYTEDGELYDGSGCHNEVKSEAPMMRKFIVDSVCMWAREYKIKGFRFDLMGLIDWTTMNEIKRAVSAIDPDIYLYGEGWTAGGYKGDWNHPDSASSWQVYQYCNNFDPSTGDDNTNMSYLGCFNDNGRDALRGANSSWGSNYPCSGLMQLTDGFDERPNSVADMVWGFHRGKSNYAKQTVNYASCHDNWTLRDQLYNTMNNGTPANGHDLAHAVITAETLVFASNGVAFMLGGEELLRTKEITQEAFADERYTISASTYEKLYEHYVSHNSYNSPLSVNSFKWGNKVEVEIDGDKVKNSETHYVEAFQQMIKLHHDMPKYSLSNKNGNFPTGVTTAGNEYVNLFWFGGYGGCLGIQFDEYFIYVTGRNQSMVWGNSAIFANTLFSYGTQRISGDQIYLGDEGYGTGYAIRVCKR